MKRPLETIDALAASGTDVHLILVGNEFGVTVAECRERAQALGIASQVHPIGPVYGDDKAAYFAAADAYISLSRRENFNFTAAESMAAGLPVILSPGNDLGGEIVDVGCAWRLEDDELETAASAIRALVELSLESLESKGANGRMWALENLQFVQFRQQVQALSADLKRV